VHKHRRAETFECETNELLKLPAGSSIRTSKLSPRASAVLPTDREAFDSRLCSFPYHFLADCNIYLNKKRSMHKIWSTPNRRSKFCSTNKLEQETRDLQHSRFIFLRWESFQRSWLHSKSTTFSVEHRVPSFHVTSPFAFNLHLISFYVFVSTGRGSNLRPVQEHVSVS
jgi:hypothetical protein